MHAILAAIWNMVKHNELTLPKWSAVLVKILAKDRNLQALQKIFQYITAIQHDVVDFGIPWPVVRYGHGSGVRREITWLWVGVIVAKVTVA